MIELNLEQINWNKLSPEEFQKINDKLLSDKKLVKSSAERVVSKTNGVELVVLRGKTYSIKSSLYIRLKKMKSEKSKQKLIDQIITENHPVEEL